MTPTTGIIRIWEELGLRRISWDRKDEWSVVKSYNIGPASIHIAVNIGSGEYRYFIDEPPLSDDVRRLLVDVLSAMILGPLEERSPEEMLVERASEDPHLERLLEKEMGSAIYYLRRALSGYGPFYPLLQDSLIEEVAVEGPGIPVAVFHRIRGGGWMDTNLTLNEGELDSLVQSIARKIGRHLSIATPFAEGLTPEGHRAALTFSREVSRRGSSIVLRKYPQKPFTIIDLIRANTISALEAAYLWVLVENKAFILIIGGMASGKSLIGSELVLVKINRASRLLTIEHLWNELARRGRKIQELGNMEYIEVGSTDLEVLTLTPEAVRWVKPKYLIRHKVREKLYRIKTRTGREIHVTRDHSLLVWSVGENGDKFKVTVRTIRPLELKTKQHYLPYLRKLSIENKRTAIDAWLASPDLGYLAGFLVAEAPCGSYVFEQGKDAILEKVLGILEKHGIPHTVTPYDKGKLHVVRVMINPSSGKLIKMLEAGKWGCGKRIPDVFWSMDEESRYAFLAGVIDGDGRVDGGRYIIKIATTSRELAYGFLYAFASVGVHAYIRERRIKKYPNRVYYHVLIPISINRDGLRRIIKHLSDAKRKQIEEAMEKSRGHHSETDVIPPDVAYAISSLLKRKEHGRNIKNDWDARPYSYKDKNTSFYRMKQGLGGKLYDLIPRGVGFDRVEEIGEVEYDGYVYDIEVPETQNFEANGIFVHNTSMLQAIATLIPPNERVVTLEDTPELNLPHRHWDPLITRFSYTRETSLNIGLEQLAKFALRRRSEYLIIGEVRGSEARILAQAAATGQGSMCLPYDERILVRIKGRAAAMPIGMMVRDIVLKGVRPEVLTYSGGRYSWKPIKRFLIVPGPNRWIELKLTSGRRLKVTPDHLIPVEDSGKIRLTRASNIVEGTHVLSAGKHDVGRAVKNGWAEGAYSIDTVLSINPSISAEPAFDIEVEENHLFIHESLLITHNCTFHADSVESAIVRLSSHPIGLGEAFLSLIWSVITMRRARVKDRGMARRASSIDEVTPEVKTRNIFSWMPSEDKHIPEEPEDVVKRSYRLRMVAGLLGVSEQDVVEELARRKEFLEILVRGGASDYRDVARAVAGYYMRGGAWGS